MLPQSFIQGYKSKIISFSSEYFTDQNVSIFVLAENQMNLCHPF